MYAALMNHLSQHGYTATETEHIVELLKEKESDEYNGFIFVELPVYQKSQIETINCNKCEEVVFDLKKGLSCRKINEDNK